VTGAPAQRDPFDAQLLAQEAYTYLLPLVVMETTRRQMTNAAPDTAPGRGPMNSFTHIRAFPTAEFRAVVRPNFDTLYSLAWLDLSAGPMVVSTPDTGGRYVVTALYDMWTNAFAAPGWRTSGTRAASWALTPPGWVGSLPDGVRAIAAPTPTVWVIVRTQTNGPADYDAVHAVQAGYTVQPIATWGQEAPPVAAPVDPAVDMATEPLRQVLALSATEFFDLGARLMGTHAPALSDWSLIERIGRLGIVPGQPFDLDPLAPEARAALDAAPAATLAHLRGLVPTMARLANGWTMNTDSMGVYGNFYVKRAIVAMIGLGANSAEDAIYPLQVADADGHPATGEHRYALRFAADQLPPVDAFWSVTMYDAEGFQVANPINRFALGDRDTLTYDSDGSLTIHIQPDEPADLSTANWLPAPTGAFGLCLRLYAPRPEALDGRWNPPALTRVTP
jgi:hypothetical protein